VRYLLYIALLLFVASLLTGVTQVRPGERVVIRRFGRVLDDKPGPGLWIGLPWGLDRVDRVSVDGIRQVKVGYDPGQEESEGAIPDGQLLTGDHNLVNVQVEIRYTIREDEVERYVVQEERVDGLIARAAETILAEWIAGHSVDHVLLNGKAELPTALVPESADGSPESERGLQARLRDYGLGVQIRDASVAFLLPPKQVKDAFDKVNQAQTQIQTLKYQAEQERSQLLGEAEQKKDELAKEARGFQEEQLKQAQTDAANYLKRLAEYRRFRDKNPDYLHDLWLEGMRNVYTQMRKSGSRMEPLDKLMGQKQIDIIQKPLESGKK
jgi:membrane protease subunit HflK